MTNQLKALEAREISMREKSDTSMLEQLDSSFFMLKNAEAVLSADMRYVTV